jgi:hypothetical protein
MIMLVKLLSLPPAFMAIMSVATSPQHQQHLSTRPPADEDFHPKMLPLAPSEQAPDLLPL